MALLAQLKELSEESQIQVITAYDQQFPFEVRCALAEWIESKLWWSGLDPDNLYDENFASNLVLDLIKETELRANNENNFIEKFKLNKAAQQFRNDYSHNPFLLIRIIKNCLNTEFKAIEQSKNYLNNTNNNLNPQIRDPNQEINEELAKVRKQTKETKEEVRRLHQEREQYIIDQQKKIERQRHIQQINHNHNNTQIISELQNIDTMTNGPPNKKYIFSQLLMSIIDKHQQILSTLQALQQRILGDELIRWKSTQNIFSNGVTFVNNLEQIQKWCEGLAEVIWENRQQMESVKLLCPNLAHMPSHNLNNRLSSLREQIAKLLEDLVTSTFIIENQPTQVIKTNSKFTATVHLLVGGQLNVNMTPPQVKVTIVNEEQVNSLLNSNDRDSLGKTSGQILNNKILMEYNSKERQLTANFKNMQLKKVKRSEKKGTEFVTDEKFSLLFQTKFKIGGDLDFHVWTLSHPIVVIVNRSQAPHGWATITWDNAFADPMRTPYAVPDKVPFYKMGEALSQVFKSSFGRGFGEENLKFLVAKALKNSGLQEFNNDLLSWSHFSKEQMPGRNFTFWEWFYSIYNLTREHLDRVWKHGCILGFVYREQAEEMLLKYCSGTFLLRFSESELGGLTIAYNDHGKVEHLKPFTSKSLGIRGLVDRIKDITQFEFLYPNIPKDQAFPEYSQSNDNERKDKNGYVKPVLVNLIPGLPSLRFFCGAPNIQTNIQNNYPSIDNWESLNDDSSVARTSSDLSSNVEETYTMSPIDDDMDMDMAIAMNLLSDDKYVSPDFSTILCDSAYE